MKCAFRLPYRPMVSLMPLALCLVAPCLAAGHWTCHTICGGGAEPALAIDPRDSRVVYATCDLGGIIKTTDGAVKWFGINHNIGNGRLYDLEIDPLNPAVVYVTAFRRGSRATWSDEPVHGELYRTRDGGATWELVWAEGIRSRPSFGIAGSSGYLPNVAIPYDARDPARYDADGDRLTDVIYVGGWDRDKVPDRRAGIWKSMDEGNTFEQIALKMHSIAVLRLHPDNPAVLYAGAVANGLWRSADEGATWAQLGGSISSLTVRDVAVVPGSDVMYAAADAIYKSTDGGSSFTQLSTEPDRQVKAQCAALMVDRTDPSGKTVFAGFRHYRIARRLHKTQDGGATWRLEKWERSPSCCPNKPSWFRWLGPITALEQARDGTMYMATWRGVYRYCPTKDLWEIKSNGIGNIVVKTLAFEPGNPSTVYLGIADSGPWKSTDKGRTWFQIAEGFVEVGGTKSGRAQATDLAISPTHPQVIYGAGYMGSGRGRLSSVLCKTIDGGSSWKSIPNGLPQTVGYETGKATWTARAVEVSPTNPDLAFVMVWLADQGSAVYRTTNGGEQWEQVYRTGGRLYDMTMSRKTEVVVCAGADKRVHIGTNAGTEWVRRDVKAGMKGNIFAIDVCPSDPNRIAVGVNLEGVLLTTDGGHTWEHVLTRDDLAPFMGDLALSAYQREHYNPICRAVRFGPRNPNVLYVGHAPWQSAGVGVLRSTDNGNTWTLFSDPAVFNNSVRAIDVDGKSGAVVAGGLEIYYYHPE